MSDYSRYTEHRGKHYNIIPLYLPIVEGVKGLNHFEQFEKVKEEFQEVKKELDKYSDTDLASEVFDLIQSALGLLNNKTKHIDIIKANKKHIKKLAERNVLLELI